MAGFTLLELLMVLAILGILFTLTARIPRDGFAVRAAATALSAQVTRARMEALRRNEYVGLRIDRASATFFLFQDGDRNLAYDAVTDPVLPGTTTVLGSGDFGAVQFASTVPTAGHTFVYDTRGIARSGAAFSVTLRNPAGSAARTVAVSAQGRSVLQ
ncbi:GspH/FimT family pseudopilin [Deinococcus petrolearius]|uniref:GspH/FimT family pseudopilin n=1 Tax=Deinococcus petrolearius TaxID=1751295 RepID=A0ABW1DIX5_9DEIO